MRVEEVGRQRYEYDNSFLANSVDCLKEKKKLNVETTLSLNSVPYSS